MFIADVHVSSGSKIEVISGYCGTKSGYKPDLVIIGNAISRGNPEAEFVAT